LDTCGQTASDCAVTAESPRRTVEQLLDAARARIATLEPAEALTAAEQGALLIDIRSDLDRERDGIVPGSLHIPRTVLEWRLDPDSPWRSPYVGGLDQRIVLLCDHGYSSVLAAATLVDLGFARAGHVIGGFAAWRAARLPTGRAPQPRRVGELAGMRPPDP
jgi:rhodanese-related sulfurtransferase